MLNSLLLVIYAVVGHLRQIVLLSMPDSVISIATLP